MAVAAYELEALQKPAAALGEVYGQSLSVIKRLGETARLGATEAEEQDSNRELALDDFVTAVTEMLKTGDFRELLDIDNVKEHAVVDGKVRAADGTPMTEITHTAYLTSSAQALLQPELAGQVVRDKYDHRNAELVDQLTPGQSRVMVSMEPKKDLTEHEDTYTKLGYLKGLTYIQWYDRVDEDTLLAGSFSVDLSEMDAWREIFSKRGVDIPVDESPNTWIQHVIELQGTPEEVETYVRKMRADYYQQVGATEPRSSVTDFVKARLAVVEQFFDAYYPAIGEAVITKRNNKTLKGFAKALLDANISKLKTEFRAQLVRIVSLESFDDEAGRLMNSAIRYAAVEELRKDLVQAKERATHTKGVLLLTSTDILVRRTEFLPLELLHQRLAGNIQAGAEAGRTYSGCPGQISMTQESTEEKEDALYQDAYGGKDRKKDGENEEFIECEYKGTFCYCCPYNADGTQAPKLNEVTIKRNTSGVAECKRPGCGAIMDKDGNTQKGAIYERAMWRLAQEQAQQKATAWLN